MESSTPSVICGATKVSRFLRTQGCTSASTFTLGTVVSGACQRLELLAAVAALDVDPVGTTGSQMGLLQVRLTVVVTQRASTRPLGDGELELDGHEHAEGPLSATG